MSIKRTEHVLLLAAITGFAQGASITNSYELKRAVTWGEDSESGCIRLLHINGTSGCAAHLNGPLFLYNGYNLADTQGPSVLAANESLLPELLSETQDLNVKGALLISEPNVSNRNVDFSSPQSAFALYPQRQYAWNTKGSGMIQENLNFSIQYLSSQMSDTVRSRAASNMGKSGGRAKFSADLDASMEGEGNSLSCLEKKGCEPLGGHSVVGWMPQNQIGNDNMPTTLILAQLDGIGLMHENIIGADSPMSGLVALLAAMELLARNIDQASMTRRVAFAALAGEPWGYMGSKQLLWQLHQESDSLAGISLPSIDQVIEISSVGRASQSGLGANQLYIHSQKAGTGYGDTTDLENLLVSSSSEQDNVTLSGASTQTPGIPPSSLTSFLRANKSIAGVVLAEFDKAFSNPFYATANDRLSGINYGGIASAARLLASFLLKQTGHASNLRVDSEGLDKRVKQLMECVAKDGAILQCALAKELTLILGTASNYVGVLHSVTKDPQDPDVNVKNDMSRFIWNFLANATSAANGSTQKGQANGCDFKENLCLDGTICVGYHVDQQSSPQNGQCKLASVRYVESYSTKLQCKDCDADSWYQWLASSASDQWEQQLSWPPDPIWTESRWKEGLPSINIYQEEGAVTEQKILIGGVAVTVCALILSVLAVQLDLAKQRFSSEEWSGQGRPCRN